MGFPAPVSMILFLLCFYMYHRQTFKTSFLQISRNDFETKMIRLQYYVRRSTLLNMIQSWANSRSRRFYEQAKASKFRGMDEEAAEDLLAALDAAESLSDLSPLKSLGLHKLKGDRTGQWAMTINGPWRVCFRFRDGNTHDVEITDYHKG